MFEIIFLGTSASAPSIHRGLPAQIVIAGEQRFLIDCGEGTQRQILRSGVGFKRLNQILLTHSHLDHILGLGGLLSTLTHWEDLPRIDIYGGKATLDRVQALLYGVVLDYERLSVELHMTDLKAGRFLHGKDFDVEAFPVTHRGAGNFGFIFKEHDRRPFLLEKAEALGVPAGPERAQLVHGEAITLADGRVVAPEDVLGETLRGLKLVHIGDTARTDNLREHVKDADTLVIEATFLESDVESARAFGHITAAESARLALENGVKTLLLTHVSRRYRERAVIEEARNIFPNTYVVRDLDWYTIKRDQPVQKRIAHHADDDDN